jgi:hypothetical protein
MCLCVCVRERDMHLDIQDVVKVVNRAIGNEWHHEAKTLSVRPWWCGKRQEGLGLLDCAASNRTSAYRLVQMDEPIQTMAWAADPVHRWNKSYSRRAGLAMERQPISERTIAWMGKHQIKDLGPVRTVSSLPWQKNKCKAMSPTDLNVMDRLPINKVKTCVAPLVWTKDILLEASNAL